MPKFVIEREVPGAGQWSAAEQQAAARRSNNVLHEMGPEIQWVHSYVTGDKIYCVYIAPDAGWIRQHAEKAGFPADEVNAISTVIDPTTAEE